MPLDERGVPLSLPTLYATAYLRNAGKAANTIRNALTDIKALLHWQEQQGRDLEVEFRSGQFLALEDVLSIRDFAGLKVAARQRANTTASRPSTLLEASIAPVEHGARCSPAGQYNRLTTIADYLGFIGHALGPKSREAAQDIDRMAALLRRHRPRVPASYQDDDPARLSPDSEVVERFVKVGSEGHPENPFSKGVTQRRNELIFRLLSETGIRIGELLSLRLEKIDTGEEPTITIFRTQDDDHDSRRNQPVAKTKERTLPISDDLAIKLHQYITKDRAENKVARRHPYLFITHRRGNTCGQAMTIHAVENKVFPRMKKARPEFGAMHPHSFRHHMNYLLSRVIDEGNALTRGNGLSEAPISPGKERSIRAYLNGHMSEKSGDAYNRRHIKESSHKAAIAQQKYLRGKR